MMCAVCHAQFALNQRGKRLNTLSQSREFIPNKGNLQIVKEYFK